MMMDEAAVWRHVLQHAPSRAHAGLLVHIAHMIILKILKIFQSKIIQYPTLNKMRVGRDSYANLTPFNAPTARSWWRANAQDTSRKHCANSHWKVNWSQGTWAAYQKRFSRCDFGAGQDLLSNRLGAKHLNEGVKLQEPPYPLEVAPLAVLFLAAKAQASWQLG